MRERSVAAHQAGMDLVLVAKKIILHQRSTLPNEGQTLASYLLSWLGLKSKKLGITRWRASGAEVALRTWNIWSMLVTLEKSQASG